ncbi:hypothetical protein PHYPO_G00072360 [Pangasianodon hypophthalmus]|uniref:Uncharacterized protein n=1 Tax=Pangasianodon hypophthalmus TaxID=310915 RepID=A0A5N5LWE6_PANHP|nr:hypothetical protein PHYPO_G00072360 [Pangasianodon hypophthalmus]
MPPQIMDALLHDVWARSHYFIKRNIFENKREIVGPYLESGNHWTFFHCSIKTGAHLLHQKATMDHGTGQRGSIPFSMTIFPVVFSQECSTLAGGFLVEIPTKQRDTWSLQMNHGGDGLYWRATLQTL